MGTPTPKGAGVEARLPRKARVSRWGGASVEASPRVSLVKNTVFCDTVQYD